MADEKTPADRALDVLERLVHSGAWYNSAIELSHDCNGEDMYEIATRILFDAGRMDHYITVDNYGRFQEQRQR